MAKLVLGNWWVWLYRALAAGAALLMFYSFSYPWWTASITTGDANITLPLEAIRVYGWGLRHSLVQLRDYIISDETPAYQTTLAWVYLGVSAGIVVVMAWFRGWWSRLLMALVGLGYIGYAWATVYVVIAERMRTYVGPSGGFSPVHTVGESRLNGEYVLFHSVLTNAYYLAFVAGGLVIILAIIGLFIKVKAKANKSAEAPSA